LTVALCANANGTDKLKPLVIGKYLNPRCFKRINRNSLGVMYEANAKAWMTGRVFERWLKAFDQRITGRKVILLIDNAPSHAVNAVELRNTTIRFLPPNTTSRIQPMDAGIIMSFKRHYRSQFVKWLLEQYESRTNQKNLDVLTAILFIVNAWNNVTSMTIFNCFRHTKLLPVTVGIDNCNDCGNLSTSDEQLVNELHENIKALRLQNAMEVEDYINYSEESSKEELLIDQEIIDLTKTLESEETSDAEEDESLQAHRVTHSEALKALDIVSHYFLQQSQDMSEYIGTISKITKIVRNLQVTSLQQTNLELFFNSNSLTLNKESQ